MNLYVLDTDILSLYQHSHPLVTQRVDARLAGEVRITVISVEEQLLGWYSALRKAKQKEQIAHAYQRLAEALPLFAKWPALSFTEPAIDRYHALVGLKLNIGRMDLRIAAIVLENSATLVTKNVRDFSRVPNVVIENWAV
jgi:tRNA(fMet)-specific endonuclease VapC